MPPGASESSTAMWRYSGPATTDAASLASCVVLADPAAGEAVIHATDPAELFDVDVDELARSQPINVGGADAGVSHSSVSGSILGLGGRVLSYGRFPHFPLRRSARFLVRRRRHLRQKRRRQGCNYKTRGFSGLIGSQRSAVCLAVLD
jgi:hypothetical protein